jgi:hypothetical protein
VQAAEEKLSAGAGQGGFYELISTVFNRNYIKTVTGTKTLSQSYDH